MKLPSASAMQRAFPCPASFALPQAVEESGHAARRGTTVHEFLRAILTGDRTREEALEAVPFTDPGREACEQADLDQLPRGAVYEVALAWDPETDQVRVLGYNIGRAYDQHGADREREIVGSFDLAGDLVDRRVFLFDFKTGRPMVSARESWQLRTGAVMWAKFRKADEALTGHLVINDDSVRWDLWEIDSLALKDHEAQIRALVKRLRKQRPLRPEQANVVEGDHCKYCPAWSRCPAKTSLVRSVTKMAMGAREDRGEITTLKEAALAWRLLDRYDEAAKRMRAEIEKLATRQPIDLGDDYELRVEVGEERDVITDAGKALTMLQILVGGFEWMKGVGTSKKALSAVVKKALGAEAVPKFLNQLREAGVLEKRFSEKKVREVRK